MQKVLHKRFGTNVITLSCLILVDRSSFQSFSLSTDICHLLLFFYPPLRASRHSKFTLSECTLIDSNLGGLFRFESSSCWGRFTKSKQVVCPELFNMLAFSVSLVRTDLEKNFSALLSPQSGMLYREN